MRLLNPKVQSMSRKWCTEKQMLQILKKLKMKKYGFKDYAIEVEEVTVDKHQTIEYRASDKYQSRIRETDIKLNPDESYFHVYVEYIC